MGVSLTEHRKEYACVWWKACQTPALGLDPSSTKRLHPCTRGGDMTSTRETVCFKYQGWCSLYDAAAEPFPPCGFKKIVLNLQSDGCVGPRRGRQEQEGHDAHPNSVGKGPKLSLGCLSQWALSQALPSLKDCKGPKLVQRKVKL